MTERLIERGEQVLECRTCGSKWSINALTKTKAEIVAVLVECPLCELKWEVSS